MITLTEKGKENVFRGQVKPVILGALYYKCDLDKEVL